jgi:transketolase
MDTFKGAGVDFMQDDYKWHYGSLDDDKMAIANASLDKYLAERIARAEKEA